MLNVGLQKKTSNRLGLIRPRCRSFYGLCHAFTYPSFSGAGGRGSSPGRNTRMDSRMNLGWQTADDKSQDKSNDEFRKAKNT